MCKSSCFERRENIIHTGIRTKERAGLCAFDSNCFRQGVSGLFVFVWRYCTCVELVVRSVQQAAISPKSTIAHHGLSHFSTSLTTRTNFSSCTAAAQV